MEKSNLQIVVEKDKNVKNTFHLQHPLPIFRPLTINLPTPTTTTIPFDHSICTPPVLPLYSPPKFNARIEHVVNEVPVLHTFPRTYSNSFISPR
jgi:hypothetical protein